MRIFNINLEFDRKSVLEAIEYSLNHEKSNYICVVDGNVLANANKEEKFNNLVNSSLKNICDGSYIALFANKIYKTNFKGFTGTELFEDLIKQKKYRSYFLGGSEEILVGLKDSLLKIDPNIETMAFQPLPFRKAEEFDYRSIAERINRDRPDLIWVSLGAPKQERFMYRLKPFLKRGVMIGVGAVFNFYSLTSEEKRAPHIFIKYKMEWLYRIIKSPSKQFPKMVSFISIFPRVYLQEKRKSKLMKNLNI